MVDSWNVSLSGVASNGNVTQCYPAYCSAGVNPATATTAQEVREPTGGELISVQVATDGTNAGTIELYDINGVALGIDVSSAATITDTQLDDAITAGHAKLIYSQNVVATGITPPSCGYRKLMHGLAARFVAGAGACSLNIVSSSLWRKRHGTV